MSKFLGIAGTDWLNMGLDFGINQLTAKQQFERQKKMMGIQFGNQRTLNKEQYERQRLLNQQGKDLSLQQWQETNYPAQMAMLKKAGLNPALLYGMSGGGATTSQTGSGGSASAGSAASGAAQMATPMDIAAMQKLAAEKRNIDADTELKKQQKTESGSRVSVNEGIVSLNLSQEELNDLKGVTEGTIQTLNNALAGLHTQKAAESLAKTEIDQKTKEWMDRTGLNPADSQLAKMINYLSEQTKVTQEHIIYILGGAIGARELMRLLPKGLLDKLMGNKTIPVKGFGTGK